MKTLSVIIKSLKEQLRSFWILVLTLSMGPFFIFVYYLITESSKPHYTILLVNTDLGADINNQRSNLGRNLVSFFKTADNPLNSSTFITQETAGEDEGIDELKNKKADALIIIPESFTKGVVAWQNNDSLRSSKIELVGDLTSASYLISAVWANEIVNRFSLETTHSRKIIEVEETALGASAKTDEFTMLVPGILILSIIMLMFTASIAFVSEVENKTILRLKLSKLKTV